MSGGHVHTVAGGSLRPLAITFLLTSSFMIVELVVALGTGSLALLADAGHMLGDVIGVGVALTAATVMARYRGGRSHTFGLQRLEILAALANAALLVATSAYIVVEAWHRLSSDAHIDTGPVLLVAALGLGVNVVSMLVLHSRAGDSLNLRGAYLEVMSDAIASVGVIVSMLVIRWTGWTGADVVVALAIAAVIVPRALVLASRAVRVLLEAAPEGVNLDGLVGELGSIDGVTDVHDVHVWTLSSAQNAATVHLVAGPGREHRILSNAHEVLGRYSLSHVTVQVEIAGEDSCDGARCS